VLLTDAGAALLASVSLAPAAGAAARPTASVWTVRPSPNPHGALASGLAAVSCPAPGSCVAVGAGSYPSGQQVPNQRMLAERLSDGQWAITKIPRLAGAQHTTLNAVSCPVTGFCVAVGSAQFTRSPASTRLLAQTWNGTSWGGTLLPVPHGNDTLQNVFAYGLSGSTWTFQHQVNPGPDPGNFDNAVSCSSASACTSAGSVQIIGELSLAEYWNGSTWVRQATPAPAHRPDTELDGVSCDGGASTTSSESTLVEAYTGSG
jgi:hypothetical protein